MKTTKLINSVVASSIALTTTWATPAAAGDSERRLIQALIGAVAITAIATAATSNDHREPVVKKAPPKPVVVKKVKRKKVVITHKHRPHRPKACLRKRYTHHGWETYYSQSCLQHVHQRTAHRHGHGHGHRH